MKVLLGLFLIILGIVLGIWLGIFVMFIGGIAQVISSITSNPINAMGIAIGLTKFFFASIVGWISFVIIAGTGIVLIQSG